MSWIKISDEMGGMYAQEVDNPVKVCCLNDLQSELAYLQTRLSSITDAVVPPDADDDLINAYFIINEEKEKIRQILGRRINETQALITIFGAL